ncbi:TPA: hypothetical protein ACGB1E_003119, partial [Citrobacter amalonaticus]
MADAGDFGGSVPERERNAVLSQPLNLRLSFSCHNQGGYMSLKGLRFTLKIDGLPEMTTAVVSFSLYQRHSTPFVLDVDIASGLPDLVATDFL